MSIRRAPDGRPGWQLVMPDGTPHRPWWDADTLARQLAEHAVRHVGDSAVDEVTSFADPAAQTIRPRWAGEQFDLHACVEALFRMRPAEDRREAA